jgi:hypothetical protein
VDAPSDGRLAHKTGGRVPILRILPRFSRNHLPVTGRIRIREGCTGEVIGIP